jgi:hypothetical protein
VDDVCVQQNVRIVTGLTRTAKKKPSVADRHHANLQLASENLAPWNHTTPNNVSAAAATIPRSLSPHQPQEPNRIVLLPPSYLIALSRPLLNFFD